MKTKMKNYTKINISMCSQVFDRNSIAPSSGDYCQRPPPCQALGLRLRELQKQSHNYNSDLYFFNERKALHFFLPYFYIISYFQAIQTSIFYKKIQIKGKTDNRNVISEISQGDQLLPLSLPKNVNNFMFLVYLEDNIFNTSNIQRKPTQAQI